MALNISRDLYTSYGKTLVVVWGLSLMVLDKIGFIGFAATSLSSKQIIVLGHHFIRSLPDSVGRSH